MTWDHLFNPAHRRDRLSAGALFFPKPVSVATNAEWRSSREGAGRPCRCTG